MPGKEIKFAQMELSSILVNKGIISNNHMTLCQSTKTSLMVIKSGVIQDPVFDSLCSVPSVSSFLLVEEKRLMCLLITLIL
jgi:hypothetical protein